MTEKNQRVARLTKLRSEIADDIEAVSLIVRDVAGLIAKGIESPDRPEIMSLAAYVHHFYTGLETILERVVREFDGWAGESLAWHTDLLRTASRDIRDLRPAVIEESLRERLDEYRRFRHLFRHAYSHEMKWRKMSHLVLEMPRVWEEFRRQINAFQNYLRDLLAALSD